MDPRDLPSRTENPAWDIIRMLPGDDLAMFDDAWHPTSFGHLRSAILGKRSFNDTLPHRFELTTRYTWVVPAPHTLDFIAEHSGGRLVDCYAGTGYMAWQLDQLGVDVIALEPYPPSSRENFYHSRSGRGEIYDMAIGPEYFPLTKGGTELLPRYADRTMLLSWPSYGDDSGFRAVLAYTGPRIIYIGEHDGGCCGDELLFKQLEMDWEQVAFHTPVQWWGLHDYVWVYERRN